MSDAMRDYFGAWYQDHFDRRPTDAGYETNICWEAWRAAIEHAHSVLDSPARVGGATLRKGVHWATVIASAQRQYEINQSMTPEQRAEMRKTIKDIQAQPSPLVPEPKDAMSYRTEREQAHAMGWNDCRAAMLNASGNEE